MERRYRLLGVAILLVGVFGMNVYYGATDQRPYPQQDEIRMDPAGYDGEEVLIFRTVESVDQETGELTIILEDERVVDVGLDGLTYEVVDQHEITVTRPERISGTVEAGSYIQIFGTLREDSTVLDAEKIVVDYQNTRDWLYLLATALLGTGLAVGYFFRHWQVDWRGLHFTERGES